MKNRKKIYKIAKYMFKNSLTEGIVDAKKVNLVLKEIISKRPNHLTYILKLYKKLITQALAKEELIVESASLLPNQKSIEKQLLEKTGTQRIIYKTNPKFVLGAKITHGDWVYDQTLGAKLAQLTMND
ncbi:hypothetical protein A2164_02175 [Candidatus Curtissbacteria bacterium RBG_13_35_7]|uniref:Uncharacterized protein n=1 Tax=Candidatus Curtissbacteria bacterium RBG_13_35_7 TaxID=1797705 RepID=A0A1F5G1B6_9BACT|nr:MAG: hypothetical protein A2164_02175 [Candidatus Curtissbacteria bacterium RBG_13_35_7]